MPIGQWLFKPLPVPTDLPPFGMTWRHHCKQWMRIKYWTMGCERAAQCGLCNKFLHLPAEDSNS
jgi:hypothetical protein